ncbi:MAG: DUF5777 family beta-barrel protein [Flavobacteriales bacterium]|nr:DUF5777 family beta-barrel protein [Flavobacteriales bacterium]
MKYNLTFFLILAMLVGTSQENSESENKSKPISRTFGSTRIINSHSTECIEKKTLDFRISHRFGDINGGAFTLFGIDNAADIRFAFEYGVSDDLLIGLGRSKGQGPINSLIDGFFKYRILHQTKDNKVPISLAVLGTSALTYMKKSNDSTSVTSFPTPTHRLSYASQIIITRKFGDKIALALLPSYTHRNYVDILDQNGLFSIGSAVSIKIAKKIAVIGEYYYNLDSPNLRTDFQSAIALGIEFLTYGHDFHINFTNSRGFGETQFIPNTKSKINLGEFRLGFTITRNFML